MKLTPEEKDICRQYGKRDQEGRVHCFECPLALDTRYHVCKKTVSKKEYLAEYSDRK